MTEKTDLFAGVARRIITPPKGIFLIGYGDRTKGNIGVHDDLTATALVLDDGQTRLAIVALDMLAINEFVVDRVRAGLKSKAGFESRPTDVTEVVLCCSHTHSGPIAYADEKSSRLNRDYINTLVERIVEAVDEAGNNLAPARLEWSQGEADIAINRRERQADGHFEIGRNPEGVVDRSVQVVSIYSLLLAKHSRREQGEGPGVRVATLVNFACHGTILGPDNLLASADWIGAMRAKVEKELGGMALFLQGATGNLNPDMYWDDARAFEMAREEGERVAETVVTACRLKSEKLRGTPLGIARREAWLPLEVAAVTSHPPKSYRRPLLAMAGLPSWMGFLTDSLLDIRYPWKSRLEARNGVWSVPMRVNAVRLGELGLATFGAETFTEIGLAVKAQSPAKHTLLASVTDGCISYLHTTTAHAEGGYEVDMAPYAYRYPGRLAAECEKIALDAAHEALDNLWKENTLAFSRL
jgi:hypothetical protein